jgi:hypothetical protein
MAEVLKIGSHDELIAVVPHALGFRPVESIVCLPIGGGPIARVDLPGSEDGLEPWLETLTDVYLHKHRPTRVALVAFGADGSRTVETLSALGEALSAGIDVGPVLWVNGQEWTELLTATSGTLSPNAQARMDAEYAIRGRVMPVGSREELAAAMQGDSHDVAAHLPHTWDRFRGLDETSLEGELGWVGARVERFLQDRKYLSDLDAARVLVALSDTGIRDAAVLEMNRADSPVHSELWQDLTRRAPTEVRDSPATLLAVSSWLEGHGAKAWSALDQLSAPNRLRDLVTAALQQALDPSMWDRAVPAATGALMQQAALRDGLRDGPMHDRAHDRVRGHEPGINPDLPGPATGR